MERGNQSQIIGVSRGFCFCCPRIQWKSGDLNRCFFIGKDGRTVKKLLTLVLTAALFVTFAVGCGGETKKATSETKSTASSPGGAAPEKKPG